MFQRKNTQYFSPIENYNDKPSIVASPDNLTNAHIQEIGQAYLDKHPKSTMFHHGQELANTFLNYNVESSVEDKWKFLAFTYANLYEGSLFFREKIAKLFTDAFSISLQLDNKNLVLSNKEVSDFFLLNAVNQFYVAKYRNEVQKLQKEVSELKQKLNIQPEEPFHQRYKP